MHARFDERFAQNFVERRSVRRIDREHGRNQRSQISGGAQCITKQSKIKNRKIQKN